MPGVIIELPPETLDPDMRRAAKMFGGVVVRHPGGKYVHGGPAVEFVRDPAGNVIDVPQPVHSTWDGFKRGTMRAAKDYLIRFHPGTTRATVSERVWMRLQEAEKLRPYFWRVVGHENNPEAQHLSLAGTGGAQVEQADIMKLVEGALRQLVPEGFPVTFHAADGRQIQPGQVTEGVTRG